MAGPVSGLTNRPCSLQSIEKRWPDRAALCDGCGMPGALLRHGFSPQPVESFASKPLPETTRQWLKTTSPTVQSQAAMPRCNYNPSCLVYSAVLPDPLPGSDASGHDFPSLSKASTHTTLGCSGAQPIIYSQPTLQKSNWFCQHDVGLLPYRMPTRPERAGSAGGLCLIRHAHLNLRTRAMPKVAGNTTVFPPF